MESKMAWKATGDAAAAAAVDPLHSLHTALAAHAPRTPVKRNN